ncbi:MAG: dipeptidase PepE [Thermoanaerobaculia bacterium]
MTSLLLISSSTVHGGGYLDHVETELKEFLSGIPEILFVPYALHDRDGYAAKARERFSRLDIAVKSLHAARDPLDAIGGAGAIFVGGGNTFRLLKTLGDLRLRRPLRKRVLEGALYIGSSAGTNLACPTIRTTNDMPIVSPSSLAALKLVPFQINAHYLDPDPGSTHKGETREERIRQLHEEPENREPVVGLRENVWLLRRGASLLLKGPAEAGARLFRPGREPTEYGAGADLSFLLQDTAQI